MVSMAEAGTTQESSNLLQVVGDEHADHARKVGRSQAGNEHAPSLQGSFRVRIEKIGRKSLDLHTVDPLLTK